LFGNAQKGISSRRRIKTLYWLRAAGHYTLRKEYPAEEGLRLAVGGKSSWKSSSSERNIQQKKD
tara:strand:+ start:311 stop:502 length:192 start_codon:yes stop_codon:yes gene_type:complete